MASPSLPGQMKTTTEIFTPEGLRLDGRTPADMRPVTLQPGIAPHASGSVLCRFGDTQVICAATIDQAIPGWMKAQGVPGGWITAEYEMLPYSTLTRKSRAGHKGKQDGRSIEIQRLIGRALRAVTDLQKLPGLSLWVDCDVLQADGGTRTAAITGAFAAATLAVDRLIAEGTLAESPFTDSVAAVSVGHWQDRALLDLNYIEDAAVTVDCNVVMTGTGRLVEVQSAGEEATFTRAEFNALMDLAEAGIRTLTELQNDCVMAVRAASDVGAS
ncbi:MAG: ribonuclease PH [Opitutales bacterium]